VVARTVPFLYQTSSCPFNEEVDFFDFLIDTEKNEKRELAPAAPMEVTMVVLEVEAPTMVPKLQAPMMVPELQALMIVPEVEAPTNNAGGASTNR